MWRLICNRSGDVVSDMDMVAFDIRGSIAHFRRPDTTATHLTYPFITPTAAKGIVGAILGIEDFVTSDKVGIRLLKPVRTVAQQMSMLGKESGPSFNRPTTIELLVEPSYRIYYAGTEYTSRLIERLQRDQSVYPTFLGVAYALTKPELYKVYEDVEWLETETSEPLTSRSIVPVASIRELVMDPDRRFGRAGGFLHEYKGNRTFERSIDFIYETACRPIRFYPALDSEGRIRIALVEGEAVCLF